MVFLLQPRPIMLAERKPVAPTLLSDPAFSTDPSAHPYAVRTTHEPWLSSPPPGHPTLNSKSRRRRSGDDPASDSEPFHIIPPPNSPVNFAPQSTTPFSVPHHVVTETVGTHSQSTSSLTTAAEPLSESKQSHHWQPNLSPAPITTAPTPATPRRRITLMTILKRRSTQQPQSVASVNSIPRKALTSSKSLSNKADVTRIHAKPNRVSNEEVIPPKPVTLGNSMPPIPSTMHPTTTYRVVDIPTNRLENLDRIDELDETNPWGIGFHHGGPYEAAAEAIRGKVQKVFPGHGSYNRGAPHSNDNDYSPPQATGLSLNLSPGQILPRNYQPHYTLPSQQVQNSIPPPPKAVMMMPPARAQMVYPEARPSRVVPPIQGSATLPASSRRQSYQTFSTNPTRDVQPRRQSFNTPSTSQITLHTPSPLSSSVTLPQPSEPHRIPPSAANHSVTNLQPVQTSIPVEIHHSAPNRVAGIPLSPINLVSIGIGMAMLDDDSDDSDEEESSETSASSQPSAPDGERHPQSKGLPQSDPAVLRKPSPERTQLENSRNATCSQEVPSFSVSSATRPRKPTLEELLNLPSESPPPYSSPTRQIQSTEFSYLQNGVTSQPSSTSSLSSNRQVHANLQTTFAQDSRAPLTLHQPAFRPDIPRNQSEYAGLEDSSSIHPSVSSKSSSSRSSGPPSSRHFPKRLVMPAPLAQSGVALPQLQQFQNHPRSTQLPPQRPIRQSLPHLAPLAVLAPLTPEPIPSAQAFVKAQAREIHFASSKAGKLKKRMSLMGPASQLNDTPVVTSVSFAPGFNKSVAKEENLDPLVMDKVHKRVLSKRKSNW